MRQSLLIAVNMVLYIISYLENRGGELGANVALMSIIFDEGANERLRMFINLDQRN